MNTILIIEDELIIARHLKEILDAEGYNAIDGIKSIEIAKQKIAEHKPNLILLDINLNGYNEGITIGHYIQSLNTIPFMYITSFSDKKTLDEAKDTRPYGYIVKPYKAADIVTAVAVVLNNFRYHPIDVSRSEVSEVQSDVPFQIKKVISHIQQYLGEQITIEDLAKLTPWTTSHFTRLFTKYMGMSPYQFIIDIKIRKAMLLAETTEMSASDISFELGFLTYSSFTKNFKRISGHTFTNYRLLSKVNKHF
jgi:AraC-like DNA-binding protein/CheY-like chemotaxis protein